MFFVQAIINFFIPSGSGQAMVTLPIMVPAADIIGLNRQIAILAYQFGDGLSNLCYPTVGGLIAFLMYSKVSFNKWLKYIMPFMLLIVSVAIIFLIIAVKINFGPF
ncbi:TIGR00366 family protein [Clostridium sp.]|uniref:TIGR00366 family protein n=1 Tax=Clostridium sp. TaxID=1506 RepID=UPI003D6D96F3